MLCPERGMHLQCDNDQNSRCSENKGDWEKMKIEQTPDGKLTIKGQKDTFLKANPDGSMRFDAYEANDWEKFTMEYQPEGTFALKTFHDKYVCF